MAGRGYGWWNPTQNEKAQEAFLEHVERERSRRSTSPTSRRLARAFVGLVSGAVVAWVAIELLG